VCKITKNEEYIHRKGALLLKNAYICSNYSMMSDFVVDFDWNDY